MSQLSKKAAQFRQKLLDRDEAAASALTEHYAGIWGRLEEQLNSLGQEMDAARKRGEKIDQAWLLKQQRLETLQQQAEAELRKFAQFASERVRKEQEHAVLAAQADAAELTQAAYAEAPAEVQAVVAFDALPTEAVEDLIGFASDGTPLRKLFDAFGASASAAIRDELVIGVATGRNPNATARAIRRELGGDLVRARRIARTETLRAYRESTRRAYEANDDVVAGWRWRAAKQRRTCACCLAMDGQEFPATETLDGHPNCRCTMEPVTRSWAELGFPDIPETRPKRENGEAWLKKQPLDVQKEILGEEGQALWAAGDLQLSDFVGRKKSPQWGTMRHTHSIAAAKKAAMRRKSGKPATPAATTPLGAAATTRKGTPANWPKRLQFDLPPKTGMPEGPSIDRETLEGALRIAQAKLPNLGEVEIRCLGEIAHPNRAEYGFVDPKEPDVINLLNSRQVWEEVHQPRYLENVASWHQAGVITEEQRRNFEAAVPLTYVERLAENLYHEDAHVLALAKVGDYRREAFDWSEHLPADLHGKIVGAVRATGLDADPYTIGEVISEDARRALTGPYSRISQLTYRQDVPDPEAAHERALEVWKWLNEP